MSSLAATFKVNQLIARIVTTGTSNLWINVLLEGHKDISQSIKVDLSIVSTAWQNLALCFSG